MTEQGLQRASLLHRYGWVVLLVASAIASAIAGFALPAAVCGQLWLAWGMPIVYVALAIVAALLIAEALSHRNVERSARRIGVDLAALAVLAAVAILLLRQIEPEMRIQADESLLVGTSFGLHLIGKPLVPSAGHYDAQGVLHALMLAPDQRGLLFPLLLNAMHALLGYSPRNGLILNGLLLVAIPMLVYAGLRRTLQPPLALAAALLVLAHPVLLWSGASSGFELVNLVMLLACWLAVQAAEQGPSRRWLLVAVLGALASQARYESVLFGALMLIAAAAAHRRRPPTASGYALALVPLLYLPFAWQRASTFELGLAEIGAPDAFGLGYLASNALHALKLFVWPSSIEPLSPLPLLLSLGGIVALWRVWRLEAAERRARWSTLILILGVLASMLPALLLVWGDLGDPITARLGLPLMLLIAIAGACGIERLCWEVRWRQWLAAVLASALVIATIPAVRSDYGGQRQMVGLAQNATLNWLRTAAPGCRPLFVEQFPTYFVVHGHSAISGRNLEALWPQIRTWAQERAIDSVLWLQIRDVGTGRILPHHEVPEGFSRREVLDARIRVGTGLRIFALDRADAPLPPGCPVSSSGPRSDIDG